MPVYNKQWHPSIHTILQKPKSSIHGFLQKKEQLQSIHAFLKKKKKNNFNPSMRFSKQKKQVQSIHACHQNQILALTHVWRLSVRHAILASWVLPWCGRCFFSMENPGNAPCVWIWPKKILRSAHVWNLGVTSV